MEGIVSSFVQQSHYLNFKIDVHKSQLRPPHSTSFLPPQHYHHHHHHHQASHRKTLHIQPIAISSQSSHTLDSITSLAIRIEMPSFKSRKQLKTEARQRQEKITARKRQEKTAACKQFQARQDKVGVQQEVAVVTMAEEMLCDEVSAADRPDPAPAPRSHSSADPIPASSAPDPAPAPRSDSSADPTPASSARECEGNKEDEHPNSDKFLDGRLSVRQRLEQLQQLKMPDTIQPASEPAARDAYSPASHFSEDECSDWEYDHEWSEWEAESSDYDDGDDGIFPSCGDTFSPMGQDGDDDDTFLY